MAGDDFGIGRILRLLEREGTRTIAGLACGNPPSVNEMFDLFFGGGLKGRRMARPRGRGRYLWVEHEAEWERRDRGVDAFYVYVILCERDGSFYVGQTRNLLRRVEDHVENRVAATRYKNAKICWFNQVATREAAERDEALLKERLRVDRQGFGRMVLEFLNR